MDDDGVSPDACVVQEKLMQMYFPEESKSFQKQEKIRRRKERMSRRYGRRPIPHDDDDEEVRNTVMDASSSSDAGQKQANEAKPRPTIPKGRVGNAEAISTEAARSRKLKTADGSSKLFAADRNATASKEDMRMDVIPPHLLGSLPRRDLSRKSTPAIGKRVATDSLPDFVFAQLGLRREEATTAVELDDQDIDYEDDDDDEEDEEDAFEFDDEDDDDESDDDEDDDDDNLMMKWRRPSGHS